MSLPLSLYIGLRHLRAKQRDKFISFISLVSVLGIALSITALITILSVTNGFAEVMQNNIFNMSYHITVYDTKTPGLSNWKSIRTQLLNNPNLSGVSPFLFGQGLLMKDGQNRPAMLYGVLPSLEKTVSNIPSKITQGQFKLQMNQNNIILGTQIASQLQARVGSKIRLLIPIANPNSPIGIIPQLKDFTVSGIFRTGKGFGFDNTTAYIHLKDMQDLHQFNQSITGLHLTTYHLYDTSKITTQLSNTLLKNYIVTDWTEDYGNFIEALKLQKTMMFCALLLLIGLATFNLVSSLMMMVSDKTGDIAILKTLGASARTILQIFIVQGTLIGLMGIILGLGGGILLSYYIGDLISLLETLLNIDLFSFNYLVDQLPSKIEILDLIKISLTALCMSMCATLYPAWRASKIIPFERLRYE